ncbi:hypothetical protein GPZ77_34375 (plasmid) [Streptomyces sp. QHH-9511]|uniref:hypothetical protein n=1 Tax=Streptomyces sp. QHH-9511 TaxID=2684468 RepID=UPI001317EA20|nr:hypothetical protein [Streptomyces sp. QHH-9511]QGZ53319.1 hypothetical protein GPZ77_34375 [Streptomyces sp. QHH-9511]
MDITTTPRDHGVHVIQTVGMLNWPEGAGVWQAHGVRLDLMDGRQRLAVCKLEVEQAKAKERGALVATQIEPWVKTLRYLAVVRDLRSTLYDVDSTIQQIEEEQDWNTEPSLELVDKLEVYATGEEIDAARAASDGRSAMCACLGPAVATRYRRLITQGLRAALAFAPDPADSPIHPAWEQPSYGGLKGESTAQMVARDLLTAWADVRDRRDPLITWAVQDAGLTRTEVQQTTSISRSTINRLLPSET